MSEQKKVKQRVAPKDRVDGYPIGTSKFLRRFFEIIPGAIQWTSILAPIVLPLIGLTEVFIFYLSFLAIYWSIRSVRFTYGLIEGYRRYKRDMKTDWMELIKKDYKDEFEDIRYAYLCPVYAETVEDTLDATFKSWSKSDVGAEKIDVLFAIEERKQELQLKNFEYLKKKYGKKFGSMQYYIHPKDIPGEVRGVKGGNLNWAARHFVKDLEKKGKDIKKYLLITCDSDQRVHPKYLSAITHKYFSSEERDRAFYSTAVHTFNNNIWSVPPMIRAYFMMSQMSILQTWVVKKKYWSPTTRRDFHCRATFSSFVVNLNTLKEVSYWNPEISNDDTAFYWNALVRFKGNFRGEEVYVPTYNDAVENESFLKTHVSFYKQQYRWGWGIINFPLTLASVLKDPEFPTSYKLLAVRAFFENQIWYITIVYTFSLGLKFIPLFNPAYSYSAASVNINSLFGILFSLLGLSNIPLVYIRRQITPVPRGWKWWRHIQDVAENLLLTVNMLTFNFIPHIQAPTEMMLGLTHKKKKFYITEKISMKKKKN
jgi:hypothetical protein